MYYRLGSMAQGDIFLPTFFLYLMENMGLSRVLQEAEEMGNV